MLKIEKSIQTEYLLLSIILLIVGVVYYPGLESRFILDDHYNLSGLAAVKTEGYINFVFSGFAGPSGRPLSLITFAIQHNAWPNNPFQFKLFNLGIHLFNGILVFILSKMLISQLTYNKNEKIVFSLLLTFIWLIHTMQVSTVLYAVQRMTLLASTFTLLGIVLYIKGRKLLQSNKVNEGFAYMSFAVAGGTCLAILAKESGILLPLYILVIEIIFSPVLFKQKSYRIWAWAFLIFPLVALMMYLASSLGDTLSGYQTRTYSVDNRLFSQPIVLVQYLTNLIIPNPSDFALFHDDFPVSSGLLSPPKTLISILIITCLLITGFVYRNKFTLFSFAVFWFFAGHSLEASHVNLELYFEHRNYLPSIATSAVIASLAIYCYRRFSRSASIIFMSGYLVLVTLITYGEVMVWANPVRQAVEWARSHPGSVRALDTLAGAHLYVREYENASITYERILEVNERDFYPYL
ncbi:MAG: hypothetical protein HN764_15540, partial [Gammaproteobacteria bacterium]|nr:hypothetical protein [Gammaproteobacteria bacterium]